MLHAEAQVIVGPSASAGGLRPFGIDNLVLIYGEQVVLKEEGGDGETGNFGGVAFDEIFGASIFKENILYGYDGTIEIGDIIHTEPGNMASSVSAVKEIINSDPGATFDNFSADSPRVWTIPILDDMDVAGREEVVVVGFAAFFIEDIEKKAGQAEVTGRFVQYTTNGELDEDAPDLGLYAMKLNY